MSTPEEVATALENAADYIEVHGWCQHRIVSADGRVCIAGALKAATGGEKAIKAVAWPVVATLADAAIYRRIGQYGFNYNDTPGRTEFEVIDVLRLTAKDLRNGEIEVAS